jgi:Ca-activated chloride channel family protein
MCILFAAYTYWKREVKKRIGDAKLVKQLTQNHSARRSILKFLMLFIAFALGIVAAMNLVKTSNDNKVKRSGIDIVIALDVSKSMLAADLAPDRLSRAKHFISKMIDEMPDDRFALILFAGRAYLQMPLTTDHGAAKMYVSSAGINAVPQQGTIISDALETGNRVFSGTEKRYKTIILITDGEDHDENAIRKAKQLAEQGVMIISVGIGSAQGSVIPDPVSGGNKKDEAGNIIISKLNEELLKSVAALTNGIYINLQTSEEAVWKVKSQLAQIERKALTDINQMGFRSYFMWFAAAMLILLIAENFIAEVKKIGT